LFYLSVWILESLRQGLHVVASWDYHRGAKIRDSVRGNSGSFHRHFLFLANNANIGLHFHFYVAVYLYSFSWAT
jgi:hypothetical protein